MTDRFTVRAVVIGLILVACIGAGFMGLLALDDKGIPEALSVTTGAAIGGLTALLARTSVEADAPLPSPTPAAKPSPNNPF